MCIKCHSHIATTNVSFIFIKNHSFQREKNNFNNFGNFSDGLVHLKLFVSLILIENHSKLKPNQHVNTQRLLCRCQCIEVIRIPDHKAIVNDNLYIDTKIQ